MLDNAQTNLGRFSRVILWSTETLAPSNVSLNKSFHNSFKIYFSMPGYSEMEWHINVAMCKRITYSNDV